MADVVHSRRTARGQAPTGATVSLDGKPDKPAKAARTVAPRTAPTRTADAASNQGRSDTYDESLVQTADRGRQTEEEHNITRRTRTERSVDTFAVADKWKRQGWDYQFWVTRVLGQQVEGTTEIFEGGWRPVYWKDVPKPWTPGAKADEQIERGGQLLYTRPMKLTQQAKREEYNAAEQQKMDRMRAAQEGKVSGQEGIADIRGVRPVNLGLEVQGEVGTHSGHTGTE